MANLRSSNINKFAPSFDKIRSIVETDGACLIRGLIPKDKVSKALAVVTQHLFEEQMIPSINDLTILDNKPGKLLSGYQPVTHHPNFLQYILLSYLPSQLVECNELKLFFQLYFKSPKVSTFNTKWLRIKVPMNLENGPLILCKGSNKWEAYDTYMQNAEELPLIFKDKCQQQSYWLTSFDIKEGDFILFHNKTLHGSLINQTQKYRISVDTRWTKQQ
ncbi:UNKNOWN [Stylonychia lemnae]|uniref:Phytanoyl-dioxygenase n=1 Tax=Stylonychia lemnae TaxID=5949 RepID=A0A078BCI7_STYLE|nr:UNKNOWN [Stylonychia lemnae]|eukprot:CDW91323.1 UNKNOWN [Stylonychia lemnae]